jgi:hypothetical protein
MTLGSHRLKGSIERLKESFCLMQKQYGVDETNNNNTVLTSYQIIGIVREKYLFTSYPKVIMRSQQQQ